METKYEIYVFDKVAIKSYLTVIIYLLLNVLPLFLLSFSWLFLFIMLISMASMSIFMGSDYLKSTRNFNLLFLWFSLFVLIYIIQFYILDTKMNIENKEVAIVFKMIRLPLVGIIYAQIFRLIFVRKYKYEPSIYGMEDRIFNRIFNKNTYHREDTIWFYFGRLIMMILIIYLDFLVF